MGIAWIVVLTVGVTAGVTFIVGYAIKARGRWYRYPIGWHLMTMTLAITVALGGMLYDALLHRLGEHIWFVIITGLVVALCHRTYLLVVTRGDDNE